MAATLGGFETPRAPGAPYAPNAPRQRNPYQPPATPAGYETPVAPKPAAAPSVKAQLPQAPAPVTADPRDSEYWTLYGQAKQGYEDQLARNGFLLSTGAANNLYSLNSLDQQLPQNIYNARVRANQQGVLGSGMENTAVGGIANQYAARRGQLQRTWTAQANQLGQNTQTTNTRLTELLTGADPLYQAARDRQLKAMQDNPAAFTPPPAAQAAAQRAVMAGASRYNTVRQAGFETPFATAAERRRVVQRAKKGK